MRKILSMFALILLISPLTGMASDVDDVHKVIASFGEAIENQDKDSFLSLFVEGDVSWYGVFSAREFEKFRGKEGMPGKLYKSSPEDFIDWVAGLEGQPKEEFSNISVNTDGEVASVYFDYKFYEDTQVQNWGSETWLLVKGESGWKIQAVNFSYTSNK